MNRTRSGILAAFVAVAIVFSIGACSDDDDPTGGTIGVPDATNPAAIEAHLASVLPSAAAGLTDGLARLLTAATGGPADGVVLIPVGNVVQAQINIDLDGDGARETTFSGSAVFSDESLDLAQGVTLTVDGVVDPNQPTADLSGSTFMSQAGLTVVNFSSTQGHLGVDPPGSGNAYDVFVTAGDVSLDILSGTPSGFTDGRIEAEGEIVGWSAFVEPTTSGGWQVRIQGEGFDFTVP
jgi:hypothetical protein